MKRLFTLLISTCFVFNASAQSSSGFKTATSVISHSAIGLVGWNNILSALFSDGSETTSTALLLGDDTEYLELTNFNITIPAGMVITGIEVEILKSGSNGITYSVTDKDVRIIKGGVITGNNLARSGKWPGSEQAFTYGSATEDWGTSWTPADINSSNFGVAISAHLGGLLLSTARINAVSINVSYDSSPLPVTMISWDAKSIQGKVDLSWSTATETNNYAFTVQRSADGVNWENIGEVRSQSVNSASVRSYTYTDEDALAGNNYYRLLQTDLNSATSYTNAIAVHHTAAIDFSIYPNPANEWVNISYQGDEKLERVIVSDLTGKAIKSYTAEATQEVMLSMADLPPGEYLISALSQKNITYKKLMVSH